MNKFRLKIRRWFPAITLVKFWNSSAIRVVRTQKHCFEDGAGYIYKGDFKSSVCNSEGLDLMSQEIPANSEFCPNGAVQEGRSICSIISPKGLYISAEKAQ